MRSSMLLVAPALALARVGASDVNNLREEDAGTRRNLEEGDPRSKVRGWLQMVLARRPLLGPILVKPVAIMSN